MIQRLENPAPDQIANEVEGFLHQLTGPTLITIPGSDSSRTRAISTLLHGNEPSGLRAVHAWLKSGRKPAVNIICFIASVQAALHEELFKHRSIPGQRDLNRCFGPPFADYPGHIAESFLALLEEEEPYCLIDIHNTSGSGPAFGVSVRNDPLHRTLVSLFTRRMVITDYRLDSIMDVGDADRPVVTIECGGSNDSAADKLAIEGLKHYLFSDKLMPSIDYDIEMETYVHPVRLELAEQSIIAFSDKPVEGAHLTIPVGIEQYNFGIAKPDNLLAWLGEDGEEVLQAVGASGENLLNEYFVIRDHCLYPNVPLKLFMVTSNATIGISDCLLYATHVDTPEP